MTTLKMRLAKRNEIALENLLAIRGRLRQQIAKAVAKNTGHKVDCRCSWCLVKRNLMS